MKPFIITHPETGANIDISSFICFLNGDTSPEEEVAKIDDAIRFINLNMQFDADALHGNGFAIEQQSMFFQLYKFRDIMSGITVLQKQKSCSQQQ